MPRVLTAGNDPKRWPWAVSHECGRCGAVFILEPDDKPTIEVDAELGDFAVIPCPSCGREVWTQQRTALVILSDLLP